MARGNNDLGFTEATSVSPSRVTDTCVRRLGESTVGALSAMHHVASEGSKQLVKKKNAVLLSCYNVNLLELTAWNGGYTCAMTSKRELWGSLIESMLVFQCFFPHTRRRQWSHWVI